MRTPTLILLAAAAATPARAGIMDPAVGVQTYRDFAENRGIYQPGATNVPVHRLNGTLVGTIPVMPDLDSTADGGWSALAGSPSFMATVAHNNATDVNFAGRFGASGVFGDSYHFINYNRMPNGYDFAAPRLNKIVTEAEAPDYFLLANYGGPQTTYPDAAGALYAVRAGGGTQTYATGNGTEYSIAGGYAYLTGGTIKFTNNYLSVSDPDGFGYIYYNAPVDAAQPLDIGIRAGDSGSPSWLWNPTTARYEYIGAGQSGGGSGFGALNQMRGGNEWAVANIAARNSTVGDAGGGAVAWNVDATGAGNIYQGGNPVGTCIGLPNAVRGATSTVAADGSGTTAASDAQMDATRNLVFDGDGAAITVANPLDLGAGSMTFNANYTLAGARLNSAGMIVSPGATVTTQLTGATGDEWRKIGAGTLVVAGTGNNPAKLNTGGGGLTELNRSGGYAVSQVKINGDRNTTVRLVGANQIAGSNGSSSTVVFGHRGGRLDLHGHDASWTHITHLDLDANIANTRDNDPSTFTFTGTGAQAYLGRFTDDGSAAAGLLNVAYNGGSGSVWSLTGEASNKGTWSVSSGEVRAVGTPTLHAGGYVDPDDWKRATFNTGTVTIADGARFTIDHHADVASGFTANGTSTLAMTGTDNSFSGNALLNSPTARFLADTPAGTTATVPGALTGTGCLRKDGAGTLRLTNPANTLADDNVVDNGTVSAAAIGALGTGAAGWTVGNSGTLAVDNTTAATVKARIATGSTGTLALATTGGNPDNAPDMTGAGYSNLFLGALGSVTVGTDPNTTTDLAQWTGGGWKLGGGGGTLTVNLRLSGSQGLTIGNGCNSGVVILANVNNATSFSGTITVNQGVDLRYTDARALGSALLDVGYGSSLTTLTSVGDAILARVSTPSEGVIAVEHGADNPSDFDFAAAGLDLIYLGAEGTATCSGSLTPGANGYRFGGDGALTVASSLSGNRTVTIDGHNMTGGSVTLAGDNSFTGTLTVRGFDDSIITSGGSGTVTLRAASATAFGAYAPVSLLPGGTLDLGGHDVATGTLAGAAGSALANSSTAAGATLSVRQASDAVLASTLSSPGGRGLNLTKSGAGTLTLAGTSTHTGVHTVAAGTLRLGAAGALGASGSTVVVQPGATFDVAGASPNSFGGVTLAGTGVAGRAALFNSGSGTSGLGQVTLAADATIGGASGTVWEIGALNPAGHTATLNTSRFNFYGGANIGAGHLVATNGVVIYMSGTITGGPGSLTLNSGATLDVRDFSNPADSRTIILNGGRIGNGYTHNGGGAQSTVSNPIRVDAASTIDGNNWGFGLRLNVAGPLSGAGALSLASGQGVRLTGDTSAYTGTATIASSNGLAFNGAGDQVFNGKLVGSNKVYKEGNRDLTLTAANTYSGGTEVLGGSLTVAALGGIGTYTSDNTGYLAVKNGAVFAYAGTGGETTSRRLWLDYGAAVIHVAHPTGALTWNPNGGSVGGANGGLVTKTGPGALTLGAPFTGAAAIQVDAGTLTLTATNSHAGATTVNGGTLVLNYAASNTTKLADAAVLTLGGGTLALSGGSHAEAVASTTLAAGTASALTRPSGTAVLAMGAITRDPGATLDLAAERIATTTTTLVNGLLPGVTVNGALATRDAGNYVVAYTGHTDVTRLSSGTKVIANDATRNVRIIEGTGTVGDITLAAATTDAATLTNTSTGGTATVAIGAGNTLRLAQAGFVAADAASQGLALTGGTLTAGGAADAPGEVIVACHGSATTTIGATIADNGAGAVTLAKVGTGTATLAGSNSYRGATAVGAGTLRLGAANVLPDGAGKGDVGVAAGATLDLGGRSETVNGLSGAGTVDNTGAAAVTLTVGANDAGGTFGGSITDTGGNISLVKTGAGTLTLSGPNTFAGTLAVNAGTLAALGGAAIPDACPVSLANAGGTVLHVGAGETTGPLSGGGTTGGNVTLAAGTLTVNQSATATCGGVISGPGALAKAGTATLTLSNNASSFTGNLTISAGTLATGTAAGGGTNGYLGAVNGSRTVTVAAGAAMNFLANNQFGGSGKAWSGIPTVVVDGGTLNATRFNILGNVTLNSGATLTQSSTDSGNYDGYEFIGGTVTVGGTGASAITTGNASANHLGGNRTTTFNVGDTTGSTAPDLVVSAPLRDGSNDYPGAGALAKTGAGTLSLAASNSYTGPTTVDAGTLLVNNPSGTGVAGAVAVNSGATLGGTGSCGGTVTVNHGGHLAPGAPGVGTTTAARLTLAAGSLLDFEFGAGANDQVVVSAADGLAIHGGSFHLYAAGTTDPANLVDGQTYNLIRCSGSIQGAGLAALAVANPADNASYTFGTAGGWVTLTVSTGTVAWDSGVPGDGPLWSTAANWDGDVAPAAGDALVFGSGADTTAHNDLPAGTSFRSLSFDAANTAAFTLTGNPVALTGALTDNGGLTNSIDLDVELAAGAGAVNVAQPGGTLTLNGALAGSQPLAKLGPGTLVLAGPNTFTGGATIAAGTLEVGGGGQLGAGAFADDITNDGLLRINTTAGQVLAGTISGTGALAKSNTGTLAITTAATFAGTTTVNAGTLRLEVANTRAGSLSGTPAIIINPGATLDLPVLDAVGYTEGTQALVINGGTVTQSVSGVRSTLRNTVTMTGGTLTSTGAGDASGNYSFNRGAGITATSDAAGNAANVSAIQITIQKTGDLPLHVTRGPAAPPSDLTISSTIADNMDSSVGTLVKTGDGILTLAGTNSYRGGTSVGAGTLVAANTSGSATGSGPVAVAAGATLAGTGTIAGTLAVDGTLAPGAGGIGTLTSNGAVTLAGTAAMEVAKSGATLAADRLAGATTLACGGTLTVTATGDPLAAGDRFTLFSAAAFSGAFATLDLPTLPDGLEWDTTSLAVDGTLAVVSLLTPIETWRLQHFATTANAGPAADTADPDADGAANLLEYALGLDPTAPSPTAARLTLDTADGHLRLSVQRNPAATDVDYLVEVSGDLATWLSTEGTDVLTEVDDPASLVVSDLTPAASSPRRFMRLRVSPR